MHSLLNTAVMLVGSIKNNGRLGKTKVSLKSEEWEDIYLYLFASYILPVLFFFFFYLSETAVSACKGFSYTPVLSQHFGFCYIENQVLMMLLSWMANALRKANMTGYLMKSWEMASYGGCIKHLFWWSKLTRQLGEGAGRFILKITLTMFTQENELLMGGANWY